MEEKTLYRKYRPVKFDDVFGQDGVVNVLKASLENDSLSHAYLFHGGRGIGKTSVARILAKEMGISNEDLFEMDAASNRGIDDIRDIRESVRVMPLHGEKKMYIIDEVHMFTKDAFNALLKTLEEPPKHVIFVLATTELHKIPETIISRCQSFNFKKPTIDILSAAVNSIVKKEGYSIDDNSSRLIALQADGAFRDAFGLLQKVISVSADKSLVYEEVRMIINAPKKEYVYDFLKALVLKDSSAALVVVSKLENDSPEIFLELVVSLLRSALIYRYAKGLHKTLEESLSEEDMNVIKELVKETVGVITSKTLVRFLQAKKQFKDSNILNLPLELAIIDLIGHNIVDSN